MLPPAFNSTFALVEVTSLLALISPLALAVTLLRALVLPLVVILPPASMVMSPLLEVRFPSAVISYAASISTSLLAVTFCIVTLPLLELRAALPVSAVTSPLVAIFPLAFAITLLSAFTMLFVVMLPPASMVMSPLLEVRFPSAVISCTALISTAFLAVTLPMVTTEPFLELMLILSDAFKSAPLAVVISPSALTVILPLCASLYLEVLMAELMVILPVFAW